jgi:hypothetical protein
MTKYTQDTIAALKRLLAEVRRLGADGGNVGLASVVSPFPHRVFHRAMGALRRAGFYNTENAAQSRSTIRRAIASLERKPTP